MISSINYSSNPFTSEECLELLSKQKEISDLLEQLCSDEKTSSTAEPDKSSLQCVIVPILSMCQEIHLFDLSSEILSKVIQCAFASIFRQLDLKLTKEVYHTYEKFFSSPPVIDLEKFTLLFADQFNQLYQIYQSSTKNPKKFYDLLTSSEELRKTDWEAIIFYLVKRRFLRELSDQFTLSEFSTCQRFLRMEIDLIILLTRLVELATNTQGGISGITGALNRLTSEEAARYFADDDFKTLFAATEEVAKIIIKLAKLYRQRFTIYKDINRQLVCSRPQPPVQAPLRKIPFIPPTVIT